MPQSIVLFQPAARTNAIIENMQACFTCTLVNTLNDVIGAAQSGAAQAVVMDLVSGQADDFSFCENLIKQNAIDDVPVVVLSNSLRLDDKLAAFEAGCDDYLGSDVSPEEACARISKSILNYIANRQLKSRLEQAHQTAYSVMSDNSDLGANLRFLLDVNRCDNLDELGMLFFRVITRYGLSCSIQMRSLYGVKNMEANGMAKPLESQLLEQMVDAGRYIDFGRRTITNYGQASILIRNMPVDDEARYGAIKDNTFTLIQGMDSRIKALDKQQQLVDERESLKVLSADMHEVMSDIEHSYQKVMRDIVASVEDMSEAIQDRIPSLALSLEQEDFFEQATFNCVLSTNKVFNEGLQVDECFRRLSNDLKDAIERFDAMAKQEALELAKAEQDKIDNAPSSDDGVDLF